ncbi:MAG: T9SS type A sorting domain-containing protein [Bacteroidales bacterium]|nr:T9SS type A sorting domain-containing protein [Bacteroidales bacterium]
MVLVKADLTTPSWTVSTLESGTQYFWQVKAENPLGTSLSEVGQFRTAQLSDRPLLLHIPFDETSGSEAVDVVSNTKAQASGFNPQWQSGQWNNSVFFPATPATSHIYFPHNDGLSLNDQSFTISLWYKSPGTIADSYLLHKGMHDAANGGNGQWIGLQYKGTKLTFAVDDNVTKSNIDIENANRWFNNEWHHLVAIRNREEGKLLVYMDGALQGEISDLTNNGIGVATQLILGNCDGYFNTPFPGHMDELRIYGEALTAGEVADLYLGTATSLVDVVGAFDRHDVEVAPNPFKDRLSFKLSERWLTNRVRVSIYDLAGRLVLLESYEVSSGRFEIDGLDFLAKGMYTCVIMDGERRVAVKIRH